MQGGNKEHLLVLSVQSLNVGVLRLGDMEPSEHELVL